MYAINADFTVECKYLPSFLVLRGKSGFKMVVDSKSICSFEQMEYHLDFYFFLWNDEK